MILKNNYFYPKHKYLLSVLLYEKQGQTVEAIWSFSVKTLFFFYSDKHQQDKENIFKAYLTLFSRWFENHNFSKTHLLPPFTHATMLRPEFLQQNTKHHLSCSSKCLSVFFRVYLKPCSLCCRCPSWNSGICHYYELVYGSGSGSEIKCC